MGAVPNPYLLSGPKRPRRSTTNYSTNYYAPIADLGEPDRPEPSLLEEGATVDPREKDDEEYEDDEVGTLSKITLV